MTAGELTDAQLLEAVGAAKHPQVEESQDTASDEEPEESSLQEQLRAVDIFCTIFQNCGFKLATKVHAELRLQWEGVRRKKQTTLDNFRF
ncbi:UNVERIFIED_CONTAM: hypothetical protein FKN15_050946 [Acipenser sinensis]